MTLLYSGQEDAVKPPVGGGRRGVSGLGGSGGRGGGIGWWWWRLWVSGWRVRGRGVEAQRSQLHIIKCMNIYSLFRGRVNNGLANKKKEEEEEKEEEE